MFVVYFVYGFNKSPITTQTCLDLFIVLQATQTPEPVQLYHPPHDGHKLLFLLLLLEKNHFVSLMLRNSEHLAVKIIQY
jgi:hypothetical protein